MNGITVYCLPNCPNCETLVNTLTTNCCLFEKKDLSDPEVLTELRVNGVFVMEAPILRVRDVWFKVVKS